jgi:hypothetical protein
MTRVLGIDLGTTSSARETEPAGTTSSAIATASVTKAVRTVRITQVKL